SRRPQLAALNDLVWLLALGGLFAIAVHADASTAAPYVAAWSAAAGCAAVVGMAYARAWPRCRGVVRWLRLHADLNVRFAVEFVLISGAPSLVLLALAAVSGYSEAAGLRGLAAARGSLRATIPAVVLLVAGGIAGGVLGGGVGAARGMVIPAWIGVGLYLRQFFHALRDADSSRLPPEDAGRREDGYL